MTPVNADEKLKALNLTLPPAPSPLGVYTALFKMINH